MAKGKQTHYFHFFYFKFSHFHLLFSLVLYFTSFSVWLYNHYFVDFSFSLLRYIIPQFYLLDYLCLFGVCCYNGTETPWCLSHASSEQLLGKCMQFCCLATAATDHWPVSDRQGG